MGEFQLVPFSDDVIAQTTVIDLTPVITENDINLIDEDMH
jgi:hypothetical protein